MLCRRIALVAVLALGLTGACSPAPDTTGPLPDGSQLVTEAAESLTKLRSVRFAFGTSGTVPGLDIREITGHAVVDGSRFGWARGEADLQRATEREQVDFLLQGESVRLTDEQGDTTERPVPAPYYPAAILDADHGLAELMRRATGVETEGKEDLGEVQAFRINGSVPAEVVSMLVPGIQSAVDVKFWVSRQQPHELVRLWMQIPPLQPKQGAVMLELALSEHNVPVPGAPGS
jgi:lipoprotein LprG